MQIKTLVVSCFGNKAQIFSPDYPNLTICQLSKKLSLIAGEYIICELINNQAIFIRKDEANHNYFAKYSKQKLKPIAANVDELVIVFAAKPAPLPSLIDNFLVLAEIQNIKISIVFNKIDLAINEKTLEIAQLYKSLGYPFFEVSTTTGAGMQELKKHLINKQAALCGASGVGKSSLINALIQGANATTGAIGKSLGKHTTSAAKLYLGSNYNLIDLPGAQNVLSASMNINEVIQGYVEIKPLVSKCKFSDCRHKTDIGCAIQQALLNKEISQIRWDNIQNFFREKK